MIRRFLYIADHCFTGPSLSHRLRRVNPSHLFYPDGHPLATKPERATVEVEDARLPPPAMAFCSPGTTATAMGMEFMRRNDGSIVGIDHTGRAVLYDPAARAVRTLPALAAPKLMPVSAAVGDDLYVMETTPLPDGAGCFEALVRLEDNPAESDSDKWEVGDNYLWQPLPPPPPPPSPCVNAYAAGFEGSSRGMICGYAVAGDGDGGTRILVSTTTNGTYSFDTASSAWSKAGDWELPFRGRAEHVPEHGLWFGISDMDGTILGAWNLSSAFQQPQPPVASLQLKGFSVESHSDDRRRELEVYTSQVVHLGGGKLCVAKMFSVNRRERGKINFAMLTGVEVVRCRGGKLRIVKHKSCRYNFGEDYTPDYLL
jgi:hypothetical protein